MKYTDLKYENEDFVSDQDKKIPQPDLVKPAMRNDAISLPVNFERLCIENDFLKIIEGRHSSRVYSKKQMSLLELSYIIWTCQGVKGLRGKK